jgi:hypothetical protein
MALTANGSDGFFHLLFVRRFTMQYQHCFHRNVLASRLDHQPTSCPRISIPNFRRGILRTKSLLLFPPDC